MKQKELSIAALKKEEMIRVTTDGWISNGHWAARISAFSNAAAFKDEETAVSLVGGNVSFVKLTTAQIAPAGKLSRIFPTHLHVCKPHEVELAVFVGEKEGHGVVAFQHRFFKLCGVDPSAPLWQRDKDGPAMDSEKLKDANFIVMPRSLDDDTAAFLGRLS